MKSRDYWKKRYQQLENASYNRSLKTIKELEPIFDDTFKEIDENIAKWYQRIAKNNEVSLKDAKKLLKDNELKEFHWTVEEYIKYGKENAINQQWLKELENASAKYHITKLEAQKLEVRQKVESLFNKEYKTVNGAFKRGYKDNFYRSCYELEKGFNVGKPITKLDSKTLDKIISKPWAADGNNFSDRIWNSKTVLIDTLHKELTRMYTLGEAPDKAIKNISKKFNVSKSQVGRLVQTEMSYFSALADKESYEKLGVKKIEIDATLDSTTCSACGSLDGTVIDLKDYEIGVNIPPYHPNCRCTTVPWFEDEFDEDERIARGKDGNQFYVPSTMKYNEWKEKYLIDNDNVTYLDLTHKLLNMSGNTKPHERRLNYSIDSDGVKHNDFYFEADETLVEEIECQKKIEEKTGYKVHLNPKTRTKNKKTPDFWIEDIDELWDLKGIDGNSKNIIDNILSKACKKKQTPNLILKQRKTSINCDELAKQLKYIFDNDYKKYIKQVVLIDKDYNIIAYYKR